MHVGLFGQVWALGFVNTKTCQQYVGFLYYQSHLLTSLVFVELLTDLCKSLFIDIGPFLTDTVS